MAKKRVKFIVVNFFESGRDYTYKTTDLTIDRGDFVIVPVPSGNNVAIVKRDRVRKPDYVCKLVKEKIDLS